MKTDILRGIFLALLLTVFTGVRAEFANETLNYVITYKWGLVHKDAGEARLSLRNSGADYHIVMTARTKPWADRFFAVRDTLTATVRKNGLLPLKYVKAAHEGGKYAKDVITYTRTGKTVLGKCQRYRDKKGKRTNSSNTLSATGPVYDMLSVFYYLRTIDYSSLRSGHALRVTVFSGSKAETLTIRSAGEQVITLRNKKKVNTYHIRFRFTTDGKKKSSEDIDAWISADGRHVPVQLVGSLPVGQVRCYLLNY